ncbi:phosphatase PAP2 family protein [Lewinella sp. LCG006]|uniref:phosphatase PAP2 family protein n=1 Tax=Lewinella sp. LCG006 TaxID=3231911 RepID=UPI00346084DB
MKHLFFFLLFCGMVDGHAQSLSVFPEPSPRRIDLLKIDGRNAVGSVLHAYSGPARWKKKEWLLAGGIAVGTYGLFLLDEEVNPIFTNQHDNIPKTVRDLAFYFGKPQYNYGLTAAVYGLGILTKNEKIRKTGILLIASATTAGLIQSVSKTTVGRARPSTGIGNKSFDFFNSTPDYHSFPSGHAILSFTTAHALARSVRSPWLKVGIYGLGSITPISRLWTNAHWLSDIGLSLAISIVSVDSVFNYLQRSGDYEQKGLTPGITWRLHAGPSSLGLVGTF